MEDEPRNTAILNTQIVLSTSRNGDQGKKPQRQKRGAHWIFPHKPSEIFHANEPMTTLKAEEVLTSANQS